MSEVVFGCFLHFLKDHCGDFLRGVFAAVDVDSGGVVVAAYYFIRYAFDFVFHLVVGFAHESLYGVDGAFGVCDCLALCGVADFAFASVDECHYGGGCVTSFAVRDDYGVFALEDCDAGVGRAQVYTDYFTHDSKCFLVLFCFVICLGWMVSIIYRTNRVPEMFRGTRRGWRGFSDVCQY